jgi:hypothetical protein
MKFKSKLLPILLLGIAILPVGAIYLNSVFGWKRHGGGIQQSADREILLHEAVKLAEEAIGIAANHYQAFNRMAVKQSGKGWTVFFEYYPPRIGGHVMVEVRVDGSVEVHGGA